MSSTQMALASAAPRTPAGIVAEGFRREPGFAAAALVLAVSILPTLFAMAVDVRLLNGVNVWEKVLKFELALAVYCATLAWFAGWLPEGFTQDRRYRIYRNVVLFCIAAEMVWIGGAAANGVGSHFNVATPAMSIIYGMMGVFAVTLTSATLVYGVAIWRNARSGLDETFRVSVAAGLVLTFVLTLVVAGYMASSPTGHWVGGNASDAEAFPLMGWAKDGGDLRVAHFFATHALHFIPAFGLMASAAAPAAGRRLVWGFATLFTAFTLYAFIEALMGLPFGGLFG